VEEGELEIGFGAAPQKAVGLVADIAELVVAQRRQLLRQPARRRLVGLGGELARALRDRVEVDRERRAGSEPALRQNY